MTRTKGRTTSCYAAAAPAHGIEPPPHLKTGGGTLKGVTIVPRRDVGEHIRLLPPKRFSPDLADEDCYYDAFEGRRPPRRGRRGAAGKAGR